MARRMSADFENELQRRLEEVRAAGLLRQLRRVESAQGVRLVIGGREFLNFSANDYLGLANHPVLRQAAVQAVEKYGAGCGASRLICGSLEPHHELEEALARFKGSEAALVFSTGYAAAVGTITALLGTKDIIILDKLVHACIVDAARMSGARMRVYAHNDLADLEEKLQWAREQTESRPAETKPVVLVVTESVFSMDGDTAPLKEIVMLKEKYGAWLMVDEAHATGLYGTRRSGLIEALGLSGRVEVQMGTLGKALGASGGFICGSRTLIAYLVNRARSFIFSTAPVPAASAAGLAAVRLVQSTEGELACQTLWQRVRETQQITRALGWPVADSVGAIVPLILGAEERAVKAADSLREQGLYIPAIRYPTVARGQARLRVTLSASHTFEDLEKLEKGLRGYAVR
jgi:8-amino-7-oxononanoate synthase